LADVPSGLLDRAARGRGHVPGLQILDRDQARLASKAAGQPVREIHSRAGF